MGPFDIVPKAPATSDPQQFQFTPPPEPQPEVPAYATPAPRHYGIFQRLMGVQHAVEAQDKADEVKFLQDAIHNAIQDQTGKIPPKQIMDWTNRLGQLIQHPEVTKALKSHVQGTLDSRAAGKALAQVNATQAQDQTGMGVPAMPRQTPAVAPTPPQRPPGLPAPPSGPAIPFGSGEQTGGAAPQVNIPLPVRASSVKGSAGFGTTPLIPLGSHFNDPTEIAVNKANADIAAQRVMAGYAPEQIVNGMNRLRAMGIDPSKLTAQQVSEYFAKGIIPSMGARTIAEGGVEVMDDGTIRYGVPKPISTAAGATTTIPKLPGGVQPGVAFNPNKPVQATPAGITESGSNAPFGSPGTSLSVPALLAQDQRAANAMWEKTHGLPTPPDKYGEAMSEYKEASMTASARQMQNIRVANLAELRKSRELQQAHLAQTIKEFNLTKGPEAIDSLADQVYANPDFYAKLSGDVANLTAQRFSAKYNLPPPRPLPADMRNKEDASIISLNHIQAIKELLKNPAIQKRMGAWDGRVGTIEQFIGTTKGLSDKDARAIQDFRLRVAYLFGQETKSVFGGRVAAKLLDDIKAASPKMSMGLPLFQGGLDAMEGMGKLNIQSTDDYRFNKRQGGAALPSPPPGGKVADEATIRKYMGQAGNDKAKARANMVKDGWTFPEVP